ncbi:hypothetical protein M501DRAFT_674300 [Patellaria atrata CBS 101060]|uniref:Uncharacterized protein n=1 Tax=Patellaria atrata CBS 101060 TaxID=1346257 RepID=A0A9P4SCG3_9PEZI|nr:hypothetical protein M501DRAFT_674300 [Patellaria atrata CBS 101060]
MTMLIRSLNLRCPNLHRLKHRLPKLYRIFLVHSHLHKMCSQNLHRFTKLQWGIHLEPHNFYHLLYSHKAYRILLPNSARKSPYSNGIKIMLSKPACLPGKYQRLCYHAVRRSYPRGYLVQVQTFRDSSSARSVSLLARTGDLGEENSG